VREPGLLLCFLFGGFWRSEECRDGIVHAPMIP
jgi:hypothetical protein